ncbi:ExeA family protein [Catenovulum sediminis]|uniref:ExeA family protein n=1 Tax=Catenovulum sediminis TaxID=1740262 RepID=UPI00117D1F85|nr:AAA family ATPase [Catenovulum sediminis]
MINAIWGIRDVPFKREPNQLLKQQQTIFDIIQIHAKQGGFSVVLGQPGVGKTVLREHIEKLDATRESTVVSCSRTMHTYRQIVRQLAEAFKLDCTDKTIEKELINAAFSQVKAHKTLYILIDEAHLLEIAALRKLRLLFERFPKNHNLVLFGQPELLHALSLTANQDIKSRITYSAHIKPLNDDDLQAFIIRELEQAKMGINTFDENAMALIIRSSEGNLRLCRNLCLASLIEAARETKKTVTITHVNQVLVQPHWRNHEQLIKQQVT